MGMHNSLGHSDTNLHEQRPFYATKAITEMRHLSEASQKTRCTPVKRDRFVKSPRNGQHPERDQNEIQICIILLKHLKNEMHA